MAITIYTDFVNNYLVKNGMIGNAANINKAPDQLKQEIDLLNTNKLEASASAVSANKLTTARTINGVSFDGTSNITITSNTPNSEIIKFDSGTTEGTDLYSFNGSTAKTIDIKAGTNVSLTKAAGTITINANDTAVAVTEITGMRTGAATFLATPSSANLAAMLTDETGTGANVFATSPTLVTPNIGVATGTSFNSITALSSTTPLMNGTAAIGTSTTVARADHVHASDTTKANLSGATFTGAISGTSGSFSGDMTVGGNLIVNGTTTTINSTTVTVDDINIELGSVATPTDVTAAGGGITLKGTTDKTISWSAANGWNSSENWNLVTGKTYKINGTDVLSATALGSGVTGSSLTSVGTITSGTWSGAFGAVSGANLTSLTAGNLTGTIPSAVLGNSTHYIGTTAVTLNRASGALALTGITSIDGNAATATKLATARTINGVSFDGSANITVTSNTPNSEIIKFDSGTTEGTDLYSFNGSTAKTIDIKAGTNVTLTKAAGSITINANDTAVSVSEITGLGTGVSTFLATPTSANLISAVTDETGTGSLVFATSPTLAGTPLAPTATVGTNTTQIATTAFVNAEIANDAVLKVASTDNAIVRFDGTTGVVQNSSITVDDLGNIGSGTQSFNGFGGAGFKNLIINGGFTVFQRGVSFQLINDAGPTFVADRWFTSQYGAGGTQNISAQSAGLPGRNSTSLKSIQTTACGNSLLQIIDNDGFGQFARGNKLSVSFWYRAKGGLACELRETTMPLASLVFTTNFVNTQGSAIGTASGIVADETWRKCTFTTTSAVAANGFLHLVFYNTANLAGNYIEIAEVQVECGTVATPFEQRPFGLEVRLCQLYYQAVHKNGYVHDNTYYYDSMINYPVHMRVTPTVTGAFTVSSGAAGTLGFYNDNISIVVYNSSANWTPNVSASIELRLSAEL